MASLLWLSGLSFLTALALVPVCRRVALRCGFVAHPRDERWHTRSTPLLGGVALGLTVVGLMTVTGQAYAVRVLLAGAGAMLALGLADDVRALKPSTRLVVQIAIASLLVFFGYRLHWVESLTADTLLTLIWIVGITNAFNFLDNMDGLCAGVAIIAGGSLLAAYAGAEHSPEVAFVALLVGACAAFLTYNVHPASIFLGDSGSLFIGVSLATVTLDLGSRAAGQPNVLAVIAAPALILLIPIFDTTLVSIARIVSGRTPATGGRDHASHRLVAIGLSERRAVATLWALAAVGGGLGVFVRYAGPGWPLVFGSLFFLATALFAVYLAQVRVYDDAGGEQLAGGAITPIVVNFVHQRRVAEVALDACLVFVAYYAAHRLRFEGRDWSEIFPLFLESLPIVVGVQMVALFATGVYQGVWRHFSLMDGFGLAKGVLAGAAGIVVVLLFGYRFAGYSRSVFVIYALLLVVLLLASRSSFRLMSELVRRRLFSGERVVVYGADDAGVVALRGVVGQPGAAPRVVGFVDDDAARHGARVHGYRVLGGYASLVSLIEAGGVDTVVLGAGPADAARLAELTRLCAGRGVTLSRIDVAVRHLAG